jgi:hypothetical protein
MSASIKIRGIYTTALTKLMLDFGYHIVNPSTKILTLFELDETIVDHEILIQDLTDLQGINLTGPPEKVTQCLTFLQERLLDATLLEFAALEEETGLVRASMEFPGFSKQILDQARGTVTPTLRKHHRFRIFAGKTLEQAEAVLMRHPERRDSLEDELFLEEILLPLEKAGWGRVEHIRPSGRPMRPREGALTNADSGGFVIRRSFSKGHYDGLDLPIQEGDYGLSEIREGAWHLKHSYYTKDHRPIGEYININSPVELYPYGARYLDLEVDVVCRAGEKPFLLDREKLGLLSRTGCISSDLEKKALQVADDVLRTLEQRAS